jgi:NADPH-dependent ferric siderophore reductase
VLICGDETALPAVAGILARLPAGLRAEVWIEVPLPGDVRDPRDLPTRADATITWLVREPDPTRRTSLLDAVQAATPPTGRPYDWIAGESGAARALRTHLVSGRGFPRERVTFSGYRRRGASEEQLRTEALYRQSD